MDWDEIENDYNYKIFQDPIHGYMKFNSLCLQFIDTKQFQRLQKLKQLGSLFYIFSAANHTRKEHSLGVGHLSGELIKKFKYDQPELNITNRDINIIRLSGLLHDLGHSAFSHVFDNVFMRIVNPYINYNHEEMSLNMIDYLIEDNNIDIEKDDINLIKKVIMGSKTINKRDSKDYMYEIVANGINGIDTDKFDYLSRDMHHIFGNYKSYNFTRLYEYNKIIDNKICYNTKVAFDIYNLFQQRYQMHKQIYNNVKGKSIEYMISHIMLYANKEFNISKSVENPKDFLYITDNIIDKIEESNNPNLKKSKELIKRLYKRDLYEFIDEYIIPTELVYKIPKIKSIDISTHNMSDINLNSEEIIIYDNKLNFNLSNKNPVNNVYFYNSSNKNKKIKKNENDVSLLLPNVYEERIIRVYSTRSDKKYNEAIKSAFKYFIYQFK